MNCISLSSLRWSAFGVVAMLLSACAGTLGHPSASKAIVSDTIDPAANGELIDEYSSASGKLCQRFSQTDSSQVLVRCRGEGESWQMARRLDGIYSDGYLKILKADADQEFQDSSFDPAASIVWVGDGVADSFIEADFTEGLQETLVEEPTLGAVIDEEHVPHTEVEVLSGETLWAVAKRVTGKGNNWVVIAKTNGMADADHVRGGQKLLVPSSLIRTQ